VRATGFENVEPPPSEAIPVSARPDSDGSGANAGVEAVGEWGGARTTCDRESTGADAIAVRLAAAFHQWVAEADPAGLITTLDSLVAELRVLLEQQP
jgi:hypothetical protein